MKSDKAIQDVRIEELQGRVRELEQRLQEGKRACDEQNERLRHALEQLARSEAELQDRHRLFQRILDSLGDGVVVVDENGSFVFHNPAADRIAGYTAVAAADYEWQGNHGFFHTDQVTRHAKDDLPLYRAMRGEAVDDVELFLRNEEIPQGVFVSVTARPLKDEQGRLRGGVVTFRDVTERRQAAEEQRRAAAELARSNADLQQFAYTASHDLQEPLRMIVGFLELLVRNYEARLDDEGKQFIGHAVESASRMQALIRDLLTYSQVGKQQRILVATDMNKVTTAAVGNLLAAIEESGATIRQDPLPAVQGDSSLLIMLMQNLIGNALKFRGEAAPQIQVSAQRRNGGWLFRVKDNGIGIAPQHLEKIFVIFHRLHRRDAYPGTGIGLAICKRIVERHGGRIWAEAKPESGSVFCFTLSPAQE